MLALALLLCSAPAAAERVPPPEVNEVPIEIPDPTPTGLLIAWKPAVLSVRVDKGTGTSTFGSSDRFRYQPGGEPPPFEATIVKSSPYGA